MASEALPFSIGNSTGGNTEAERARALARERREQAVVEEELAEKEKLSQFASDEEAERRRLEADRRKDALGKKRDGGPSVVGAVVDTADQLIDLITAIVEFELIVPALALLTNYHVRFVSGNLGAIPEAGGPLSYVLDKIMELSSAGAKTAGKAAGKSAAGAGVDIGSMFEVKKLAIWQIFIMITMDALLAFSTMVSLLTVLIIPILILSAAGGLVFGFCTSFPDVCTSIGSALGVTI